MIPPITSPGLENGGGSLYFLEVVREWSMNSRLFALRPKPGLCPDQPVSPKITARQEMLYDKWGGLSECTLRCKRAKTGTRVPRNDDTTKVSATNSSRHNSCECPLPTAT